MLCVQALSKHRFQVKTSESEQTSMKPALQKALLTLALQILTEAW